MDICFSVRNLVSPLISHPELLRVDDTKNAQGIRSIVIRVSSTDMRKVIGNSGKIFRSIRTLIRSALQDYHIDVTIDVVPQENRSLE